MDQNPTGDAPQGQRSKAIFEIGYEVLLATDLNEALTVVVEGVRKVLSAEASAAITLVDRTGRLDPGTYQVAGPMSDVFLSEKPRPVGGLGAWVVDKKTAIYESDVQATESREHPAIRQNRLRVGAYACLPLLLSGDQAVGTLFIAFLSPFEFEEALKEVLASYAQVAARAVGIARAKEQQTQVLKQMSTQLLTTWHERDPDNALKGTLEQILRQVEDEVLPQKAISASIYIYDEAVGFYSGAATGPLKDYMEAHPPRVGDTEGTALYTIRAKTPLFVGDTREMPVGVPSLSRWAMASEVRALANLPMLIGEGDYSVVGILIINLQQPLAFSEDMKTMLRLFADRAAIALQAARVHRRRLREQEALAAIGESAAAGSLAKAWEIIAKRAIELTNADYLSCWALDETGTRLVLQGAESSGSGWPSPDPARYLPLYGEDAKSINRHVFLSGKEHYSEDLSRDPYHLVWDKQAKSAFCVPLLASGQLIGTLYAASERLQGFTEDHRGFIRQMAPHAAVALHNARLLERARAFQAVVGKIHEQVDLDEVSNIILRQLQAIVPYKTATLQLIFGDKRRLLAHHGFDRDKADPDLLRPLSKDALVNEIVVSGKLRILSSVIEDRRWGKVPGVGSWCCIPLVVDTKVVGILTVDHPEAGFYTYEAHSELLQNFANHAALALRDAQRQRDLNTLRQWALELDKMQKAGKVYDGVVKAVVDTLECAYCIVFLAKPDGTLVAETGGGTLYDRLPSFNFPPGKGLAGRVYQNRASEIVPDTSKDDCYLPGPSEVENNVRPRSILSSLLRRGDKVIGVVSADFDRIEAFDQNDLHLLDTLTAHASIVLQNLEYMDDLGALHDAARKLTGLPKLEDLYQTAVEAVSKAIHASHSTLFIYNRQAGKLTSVRRWPALPPARSFRPGEGLAGTVFQDRIPMMVNDAAKNQNFVEGLVSKREESRSIILAPVRSNEDAFGVLTADKDEIDGFTERDLQTLETLALDIGIAIKAHEREAELAALGLLQERISAVVPVGEQLENIYNATAEAMSGLMDTRNMYIALYNAIDKSIEFPLWYERGELISDWKKVPRHATQPRHFGGRLLGSCMAGDDVEQDALFAGLQEELRRIGAKRWEETTVTTLEKGLRWLVATRDQEGKEKTYTVIKQDGRLNIYERFGLTDWVILHKESLLIQANFNEEVKQRGIAVFDIGTRCWLGAPMLLHDEVVGVIGLQNFEHERVFDDRHRNLLKTIASQAAIAIQNAWQYETIDRLLDRRSRELAAVSQFQQAITSIRLVQE